MERASRPGHPLMQRVHTRATRSQFVCGPAFEDGLQDFPVTDANAGQASLKIE